MFNAIYEFGADVMEIIDQTVKELAKNADNVKVDDNVNADDVETDDAETDDNVKADDVCVNVNTSPANTLDILCECMVPPIECNMEVCGYLNYNFANNSYCKSHVEAAISKCNASEHICTCVFNKQTCRSTLNHNCICDTTQVDGLVRSNSIMMVGKNTSICDATTHSCVCGYLNVSKCRKCVITNTRIKCIVCSCEKSLEKCGALTHKCVCDGWICYDETARRICTNQQCILCATCICKWLSEYRVVVSDYDARESSDRCGDRCCNRCGDNSDDDSSDDDSDCYEIYDNCADGDNVSDNVGVSSSDNVSKLDCLTLDFMEMYNIPLYMMSDLRDGKCTARIHDCLCGMEDVIADNIIRNTPCPHNGLHHTCTCDKNPDVCKLDSSLYENSCGCAHYFGPYGRSTKCKCDQLIHKCICATSPKLCRSSIHTCACDNSILTCRRCVKTQRASALTFAIIAHSVEGEPNYPNVLYAYLPNDIVFKISGYIDVE